MKRKLSGEKKYTSSQEKENMAKEAAVQYEIKSRKQPYMVKDFSFSDFERIAKESPFTLADWA